MQELRRPSDVNMGLLVGPTEASMKHGSERMRFVRQICKRRILRRLLPDLPKLAHWLFADECFQWLCPFVFPSLRFMAERCERKQKERQLSEADNPETCSLPFA